MRYAIEIRRRSHNPAFLDEVEWRYYRFKWSAKLVVWWLEAWLGPNAFAKYLGETL